MLRKPKAGARTLQGRTEQVHPHIPQLKVPKPISTPSAGGFLSADALLLYINFYKRAYQTHTDRIFK